MPIFSSTRAAIRHETARIAEGDGFLLGTVDDATASAPGSGYFYCSLTGWEHDDDYFNDWKEVYCYDGTSGSIGESGNPTDWSTTAYKLTFSPAQTWLADDSVEMHQVFTVDEYNNALNRAVDSVAKEALEYKVDETIVFDNILTNSLFETDATMTGWTDGMATPTVSERSTTFAMEGTYSAKVTSDGTNEGIIYQQVSDYAKYLNKSYLLRCKVHTTTASRVRLCVYDGVTSSNSSYHAGKEVEELYVSGKVGREATELTVQLRIEAGSTVTAYFDACYFVFDHIYEYNLPTSFMYVHKLEMESTTRDRYDYIIPWGYWRILPESTPRLWFDPNKWSPTAGRKLRIHGMASPARLTADTQTCSINPTFLAYKAAADLHLSRARSKNVDTEDYLNTAKMFEAKAEQERQQIFFDLPMGSKAVLAG